MKTAQELYQEKKMSAEQVLDHIQSKDFIVCAQAAAEPAALLQKMEYLKTTGVQDVLFSSCVPAQDYSFFHDERNRESCQLVFLGRSAAGP